MARQRIIRAAISLGSALVLLISASALSAVPAAAGPVDDEQRFLQLINQTRAGHGLPPLVSHGELRAAARSWSSSMAEDDQLTHAPHMAQGITANWIVLGENVGVHGVGDVDQLFQAFVASPSHYQNLMDPRFQYVGIGVVHTSTGKLWTTHRFMATETPPPTTAPPTVTAPTIRPTTTPTTTATTTTRATVPPTTRPTTTPSTTSPPTTSPPTTDRTAFQPSNGPSTTVRSGPADPSAGPAAENDGFGGDGVLQPRAEDGEPDQSELIQPDAATIEDVLIDLVAAGI